MDKATVSVEVGYINDYCQGLLGRGAIRCELDPSKGRVLVADRPFRRGERLFAEPPLLLVAESPKNPAFERLQRLARQQRFAHAPLWYWSALCSLTEDDLADCCFPVPSASQEKQKRLLLLSQTSADEAEEACSDVVTLVEDLWPPEADLHELALKLDRLLVVWLLNCFEHCEDPPGFSTFFLPSFLSHSCQPNCMWHYTGDDFTLRAREDVARNEEVTVSYLSEEALLESTASRRKQLEATKHFTCCCERCEKPLDDVRGFTCPSCGDGVVFLDTSRAAAAPTAIADGACGSCGFLADKTQVAAISSQEARLESLVHEWDRKATLVPPQTYLTDAMALRLEANFAGLFSARHWLRNRCNHHLLAYHESVGRDDLALPLARKCVDFIASCYPGCSALQAWALETQGDLLLRMDGFTLSGSILESPPGASSERLSRVRREAGPIYGEATTILRMLFGEDHEFHVTMRCKCDALDRATRVAERRP